MTSTRSAGHPMEPNVTVLITRDELVRVMSEGAVTLVEALPVEHHAAGHLPGAINVPGELTDRIAPDTTRTVAVYCSGPSCGRSKVTAAALTRAGYTDVRVYPGGKADWLVAGLPMERTAAAS